MRTHILIVDDDPALIRAARALLARRDCLIDAAFSGLEAVARVRAGGIDAMLLDVRMPQVDGLSVLDEISGFASRPRTVLMSGNVDARVEEAVASGKAVACVAKPVDFDLAYTLLVNKAPDRPLQLRTEFDRAALAAFATQAITRGVGFIEGAPQLPASTPVSLAISTPEGPLTLLAVADPGIKLAGKRGLGVRIAELTPSQQQALRAAGSAGPEPVAVPKEAVPNRSRELYRRGLEKIELGKYDGALLDLRQACDLEPGEPLLLAAMARAEELAGVEKARNLFREAEKVGEADPAEALRLVEDAIRLDPARAVYLREAARLATNLGGSLQLAEERLAAAIHLAPSDPSLRLLFSQLVERGGRVQEALWACEAALQLFPGDKDLLKLQTRLQRKCGATPAAS